MGNLAFRDEFVANFECSSAAPTCLFIAPVNKRATVNRPRLQRAERAMFEFNEPTARRTADYGGGRVIGCRWFVLSVHSVWIIACLLYLRLSFARSSQLDCDLRKGTESLTLCTRELVTRNLKIDNIPDTTL